MRIRIWAVTLLLVVSLPTLVLALPAAPKAEVVGATAVSTTVLENAGIVPCHLNLAEPLVDLFPSFGKTSLVPNGGRCSSDLSCASKCCTNNICVQNP